MNEVVKPIILFVEILMVLQAFQITFHKKVKFDKYMLVVIATDLIIFSFINAQILPILCNLIVYGVCLWYCFKVYRHSVRDTIVRFAIAITMVGGVQSIPVYFACLFHLTVDGIVLLVLSLSALLAMCGINKFVQLADERNILSGNKGVLAVEIIGMLVIGFVVVNYYYYNYTITLGVVIILILTMLMFFCVYLLNRANVEIDKKKYELEVQRVYGGTYDELIREVRRKQHDYKNQLGAVYSMHLVAESLDDLVNMQKAYIDELQANCKYDPILSGCENSILAGYLYYRCLACEKEGVAVEYDVQVGKAEGNFAVHEIIEILGILIDNACENFGEEELADKKIRLKIKEDEDKISISVANPTRHRTFIEIDKMFEPGYSSKGENRGIGLSRVKELVNQKKAEIQVSNYKENEENWICFRLEITKLVN